MKPISESIRPLQNMIEQKPQSGGLPSAAASSTLTKNERKEISKILFACFDSMNTFGKGPEAMENIIEAFMMVLNGYQFEKIEEAFKIYMRTQSDMPTPANIIRLIEPPVEKLSTSMYVNLKKIIEDSGYNIFISDAEKRFMAAYEDQELRKADVYLERNQKLKGKVDDEISYPARIQAENKALMEEFTRGTDD
jgi:hypothetical protein